MHGTEESMDGCTRFELTLILFAACTLALRHVKSMKRRMHRSITVLFICFLSGEVGCACGFCRSTRVFRNATQQDGENGRLLHYSQDLLPNVYIVYKTGNPNKPQMSIDTTTFFSFRLAPTSPVFLLFFFITARECLGANAVSYFLC